MSCRPRRRQGDAVQETWRGAGARGRGGGGGKGRAERRMEHACCAMAGVVDPDEKPAIGRAGEAVATNTARGRARGRGA